MACSLVYVLRLMLSGVRFRHVTRWKVELHLPLLVIGAEDITVKFGRRRLRKAGPYLIIARACGLAFDTAFASSPDSEVTLWPPHALLHQLWDLRPTGVAGEVAIIAATNGLALDATKETSGDLHPVMSEVNSEPWQRWRLEDAADGAGYLLQSVHSRRYLTVSEDTQPKWSPWFEDRHGQLRQQWIIAQPYGRSP